MTDHPRAPSHAILRHFCAMSCLCTLLFGAGPASALPAVQLESPAGVVLAQAAKPGGPAEPEQEAQRDAPAASTELADLNEVLEATKAKLEELFEATAALAERRAAFEAVNQENQRLAASLKEANAARAELERARKQAEARIAGLTEAVDVAVDETTRIDEELEAVRRENGELEKRLALADDARGAAAAELEQTRSEMEAKLGAAAATAEQLRGELAEVREQLTRAGRELAEAQSAREQAVARAANLERSSTETERVQAELAATKQQLVQAATTAVEAERARQTASVEAEELRGELARAHKGLATARSEVDRVSAANAELEEEVASLRADSQAAMEAARRNLVVMEEKIDQLNAALARAGLAETARADQDEGNPVSNAEQPAVGGRMPPAASAPEESEAADAGQAADGVPEVAAARAGATPPPDESSELAKFNANIQYLNRRAMDAAGSNLFAGIEEAGDGVVHVSATPAWHKIPEAGQRSYLDSLLDLWIVAQEDSGPAVVRIVDASGRVLLEKSGAVQNLPQD